LTPRKWINNIFDQNKIVIHFNPIIALKVISIWKDKKIVF
jgi:hypothetical protein